MKKISIHKDQIEIAMSHNCLDILTTIPKDEIICKSILCTKEVIKSISLSDVDKDKCAKFWKYFNKY